MKILNHIFFDFTKNCSQSLAVEKKEEHSILNAKNLLGLSIKQYTSIYFANQREGSYNLLVIRDYLDIYKLKSLPIFGKVVNIPGYID